MVIGVGYAPVDYQAPATSSTPALKQKRTSLSLIVGPGVDLALQERLNVRLSAPLSLMWFIPGTKDGRSVGLHLAPALETAIAFTF